MPRGNPQNLTNAGKGRKKGSLNKATADIKALAKLHAVDAMKELARLAVEADSEPARVAAIKELFDRGFGKATQPISGDDTMPPIAWANAPDSVIAWVAAQTLAEDVTP